MLLTGSLSVHVGSPDVHWEFRPSEVPTFVGSSNTDLTPTESPGNCSAGCLVYMRTSEVPTFAGSFDTDLHALTSDSLCTVFSLIVGTSDVDLNGWIFTWSINTPLFTSNREDSFHSGLALNSTAPKQPKHPSPSPFARIFDSLRV